MIKVISEAQEQKKRLTEEDSNRIYYSIEDTYRAVGRVAKKYMDDKDIIAELKKIQKLLTDAMLSDILD